MHALGSAGLRAGVVREPPQILVSLFRDDDRGQGLKPLTFPGEAEELAVLTSTFIGVLAGALLDKTVVPGGLALHACFDAADMGHIVSDGGVHEASLQFICDLGLRFEEVAESNI